MAVEDTKPPSPLGQLCSICTRIFQGPHPLKVHGYPGGVLSQNGCISKLMPGSCCLCRIIWNDLKNHDGATTQLSEIRYGLNHYGNLHLYLFFIYADGQEVYIDLNMMTENHSAGQKWTDNLPLSTLSDASITFLMSKMKECLDQHFHGGTTKPKTGRWYPSRLIRIGGSDLSKVYLEESDEKTTGSYFTLSHCWGGSQPMQLTSESELALKAGVSVDELPKTFREAIEVCLKLDVQYIWIDSMCIFQDNLGDWHKEAAVMRNVYSYAQCNIAASGASNSNVGLSFQRCSKSQVPFWVDAKWHWTNDDPGWRFDYEDGKYLVFPPNRCVTDLESGPLNQRAWVLQERFLSQRIMHFTSSQVFWECYDRRASEVFQNWLPSGADAFSMEGQHHALKQILFRKDSKLSTRWKDEVYLAWQYFLVAYSRCGLTMEGDKLVAIAGIAQEVAEATGDEFVCGLWKNYFLQELLWRRKSKIRPQCAPFAREWRAPTWSWAHTNFQVNPSHFIHHRKCDKREDTAVVEHLDVEAVKSGQLKHAMLTLRGKLLYATLRKQSAKANYLLTCEPLRSGNTFSFKDHLGVFVDDPGASAPYKERVVCMAVYQCHCKKYPVKSGPVAGPSLEALILRRVGSGTRLYERIGVMWMSNGGCGFYKDFETSSEHSIVII